MLIELEFISQENQGDKSEHQNIEKSMSVDFIVSKFTNMHAIISATSSFDKTLLSVAEEPSTNGTGVSKNKVISCSFLSARALLKLVRRQVI